MLHLWARTCLLLLYFTRPYTVEWIGGAEDSLFEIDLHYCGSYSFCFDGVSQHVGGKRKYKRNAAFYDIIGSTSCHFAIDY